MKQKMIILEYLQFDSLTQEQILALNKLQSFINMNDLSDFFVLSGAASTGKTSITTALIGLLN